MGLKEHRSCMWLFWVERLFGVTILLLFCCSVAQLFSTLCETMDITFTISWRLLKLMSIESVMPSNHFILCHPLDSCLQSSPVSGSFPMNELFPSGGQSIGASASASGLPMDIQDWFLLGLTGLISLQSKGLSRIFSNTTVWKHQFFGLKRSWFSIKFVEAMKWLNLLESSSLHLQRWFIQIHLILIICSFCICKFACWTLCVTPKFNTHGAFRIICRQHREVKKIEYWPSMCSQLRLNQVMLVQALTVNNCLLGVYLVPYF